MSPFLSKKFPSIESFYFDIAQLGKGLHVNEIRLCGGEPLLNPEINSFIEIAKRAGIADQVSVTTNGLLLHKMNDDFWENVDSVVLTLYPKVNLEEKLIEEFKHYAKQSNTNLILFPNPIFRTATVTQPHPKDLITDLIFKTCDNVHLYHCHMIHEGKLYKCAVPPFLPEYLAKMGMAGYDPAQDAFDIHKAKDIFHELKAFLLSSDTMEACRYCLGYLGKSQAHCQLEPEVISDPSLDKITRKEYFDLHKLHKLLEDLVEGGNDGVKEFGITKISEKVTGPRCSVIIPTYNRSRYLPRAINSVLSQTFQDFEITVVDDCSTDNTVQIIQEFVKHDSRIKLLRHERNKGAQAARNTGIVNSTAEYVAFLDSDDEWLPNRLQAGFDLQEREGFKVIHSECYITEGKDITPRNMGIPSLSGNIYKELLKRPFPMFQGLLVKCECLERIGYLDEAIISFQEWDTSIRLAKHYEFGFVPEPLFIYHRCHSGDTISKDERKDAEGYYQIVEKHADEIIKYAGTEALMNHYMITLEKLKALTAYEKFQQVKLKLKTLIDREKKTVLRKGKELHAQEERQRALQPFSKMIDTEANFPTANLVKGIDCWNSKGIHGATERVISKERKFKLPRSIQISLSDCCNFRCTSCWIHGPKVVPNANNFEACLFKSTKPCHMDLDVYKNLINDIAQNGNPVQVQLCGKGEPTIHPNFLEMVKLADEKGLESNLVTNGSMLTFDMLKTLCETRLKGVNISLNACDPVSHRAYSNIYKDYFTQIVEIIKQFNASGHRGLKISLSFVIGSHNIAQVKSMAELSSSILLPGSSAAFYAEWTYPENRENSVSKNQFTELLTHLPGIKANLESSGIKHNLDIFPYVLYGISLSAERDYPTRGYYMEHPCKMMSSFLAILADGRVVPCCRSSYVLGDIKKQSIFDIWDSDIANDFRYQCSIIHKKKCELPQSHCYSCDHLMGDKYFSERYCKEVNDLVEQGLSPHNSQSFVLQKFP